MKRFKVAGYENLVRDSLTGAIINNDSSARNAYRERVRASRQRKDEIDQLKQEVTDIKIMLEQIWNELKSR